MMTSRTLAFALATGLLVVAACGQKKTVNGASTPESAASAESSSPATPAPAATAGEKAAAPTDGIHVAQVLSVDGQLDASGKTAPNFTWKDAAGADRSLKNYEGKVVMINFWGTWCPPCRRELPDIVKLRDELGPQGFEVIGVNVGEEARAGMTAEQVVAKFAQSNNLAYPLMLGNDAIVSAYGGLEGVPTTFIVNGKGEVVDKMIGMRSLEDFRAAVKKAM